MSTIITTNTAIGKNFVLTSVWPVIIASSVTIDIIEDFLLLNPYDYFIITSDNVLINGNSHNITISNIRQYPGLIQNGNEFTMGCSNFIIKDLHINSDNSSLFSNSNLNIGTGWIGQQYFMGNVAHCSSNGIIEGNYCGGIVGSFNKNCAIVNCFTTGDIIGYGSGGISGGYCDSCDISDCYSTGSIIGYNAGGIIGIGGFCNISNCYSEGLINGGSGGIAGSNLASASSITNCYSLGNINGDNAGGIVGEYNSGSINNCYTVGSISEFSVGSDGIAGANNNGNISECHATLNGWDSLALTYLFADGTWVNPIFGFNDIPFLLYSYSYYNYATPNVTHNDNTLALNSGFILNLPNDFVIHKIANINKSSPLIFRDIFLSSSSNIHINPNMPAGQYDVLVLSQTSDMKKYNFSTYAVLIKVLPCFLAGTQIMTPSGEKSIETLQKGDLIITPDNRSVPILNIFTTNILNTGKELCPVEIPADFFGNSVPSQNTYLSRHHSILWENNWIQPALNPDLFKFKEDFNNMLYYNIETPEYLRDNIIANNMICESWCENDDYTSCSVPCDIDNNLGIENFIVFTKK